MMHLSILDLGLDWLLKMILSEVKNVSSGFKETAGTIQETIVS